MTTGIYSAIMNTVINQTYVAKNDSAKDAVAPAPNTAEPAAPDAPTKL